MLAGTVAAALLLDKLTCTPPAPAAVVRVTVPVELCPAVTVDGLRLTPASVPVPALNGLTVNDAEDELAEVAVIIACVGVDTEDVETLNVPLV